MKKIFYILLSVMAWSDAIGQVELRYAESMDSGWGDANAVVTPYVTFPEIAVAPYRSNQMKGYALLCKQVRVLEKLTIC